MATVSEIYSQLLGGAQPIIDNYNKAIAQEQATGDAMVAQLNLNRGLGLNQIVAGAKARGLGFNGLPAQEQPKFFGTKFDPAIGGINLNTASSVGNLRSQLANLQGGLSQRAIYQNTLASRPVVKLGGSTPAATATTQTAKLNPDGTPDLSQDPTNQYTPEQLQAAKDAGAYDPGQLSPEQWVQINREQNAKNLQFNKDLLEHINNGGLEFVPQ